MTRVLCDSALIFLSCSESPATRSTRLGVVLQSNVLKVKIGSTIREILHVTIFSLSRLPSSSHLDRVTNDRAENAQYIVSESAHCNVARLFLLHVCGERHTFSAQRARVCNECGRIKRIKHQVQTLCTDRGLDKNAP